MRTRFCIRLEVLMAVGMFLSLARTSRSGDWPQFLGPNRNGTSSGDVLSDAWPKEGPPILWKRPLGQGFSGPVVSAGRLVFFTRAGDKERVECADAENGKQSWVFEYPTDYHDDFGFDDGPRATPTISNGKVYTFGAGGVLHCLDFGT